MSYIVNPKSDGSGILCVIPQKGKCLVGCKDCFFNEGRSFLEPLEENTPNMPTVEQTEGYVVRINDGNDSCYQRDFVIESTNSYKERFFNTSMNKDLGSFPAPVVLTVNPAGMTDKSFHKVDPIPTNLMYVRVRTNLWNLNTVLAPAIAYYKERKIDTVITFMAYYGESIPEEYQQYYTFKKRTLNSYWVLNSDKCYEIAEKFKGPHVYTCGHGPDEYSCATCGNCLRAYFKTREKIRKAS